MYKVLALIFLLLTPIARGEISTDKIAHISVGYGIQTVSYGLWKKVTNNDRETALILSTITTAILCASKEMMDLNGPTRRFDNGDLAAGMLGAGLSVGTVLTFDF